MVSERAVKQVLNEVKTGLKENKDGVCIQDFLISLGFDIQYNEYECEEYITFEDAIAFIEEFLIGE